MRVKFFTQSSWSSINKVILLLGSLSVLFTANAQITEKLYDFETDGIYYRIISDDAVAISPISKTTEEDGVISYLGNNEISDLTIGGYVYNNDSGKSYELAAIDPHAFENSDRLMYINNIDMSYYGYVPVTIGEEAFRNCPNLLVANIPAAVSSIGKDAFWGCERLKYVALGIAHYFDFYGQTMTIYPGAFANTPELSSVFLARREIALVQDWEGDAFSNSETHRSDFNIYAVDPYDYGLNSWDRYSIQKFGTFEPASITYTGESAHFTPIFNSNVADFSTSVNTVDAYGSIDRGFYYESAHVTFSSYGYPYYWSFSVPLTCEFTIEPAPLTISTPHLTREYGQPNPEIEITVSGYLGDDNADIFSYGPSIVNGQAEMWPALPDETSDVGEYIIYVMAEQKYPQNYWVDWDHGSITVTKASQIITWEQNFEYCTVGQEIKLKAEASSGLGVSYESTNPEIAVIDGNVIKFLSEGDVAIKAVQAGNKNYLEAESIERTIHISPRTVEALYFDNDEVQIKIGETYQLSFSWTPVDVDAPKLKWESENPAVAIVNNDGLVSGLHEGITAIIASLVDNPEIKASCNVTVDLTSDINEVGNTDNGIYSIVDNELVVNAAPFGIVKIYTLDGSLVYSGTENRIRLNKGLYLLMINQSVRKIKI